MDQSIENVVFVTCGTHEDKFERMRQIVKELADSGTPVLFQHGHTPPLLHPGVQNTQWVESVQMKPLYMKARACITHAGTGSIISCLRAGTRPIVVPRCFKLGEHIDDHQFEIANAFKQMDQICVINLGEEHLIPKLVLDSTWKQPAIAFTRAPLYDMVKALADQYTLSRK